MGGFKLLIQISNTKYQIHKSNTGKICEFLLVKLTRTTPKNPRHTKAKKVHHLNKEATRPLQNSLLKPKTMEPQTKSLIDSEVQHQIQAVAKQSRSTKTKKLLLCMLKTKAA